MVIFYTECLSFAPPSNGIETKEISPKTNSEYILKDGEHRWIPFNRSNFSMSSLCVSRNVAFMEMDLPPTGKSQRMPRQKRSAPPTIYPEILVIVDYDGYR